MPASLLVIVTIPEIETGIGVESCSCRGLVGSLALIIGILSILSF